MGKGRRAAVVWWTCVSVMLGGAASVAVAPAASAVPRAAADTLEVADTSAVAPAFHNVAPARLLDTRTLRGSALRTGVPRKLSVVGRAGIPTAGVGGVYLHVTVVNPAANGYLVVWPDGAARPATSNVNYQRGLVVSNSVLSAVTSKGAVDIVASGGPVDVIVDVTGWTSATGSGTLRGIAATRLLDTRRLGPTHRHTPVGSTPLRLAVSGAHGVPAAATDAVLNVTAVDSGCTLPVVVWPAGLARPPTSTLNAAPRRPVAQLVIVQLGTDGAIDLAVLGRTKADLIVDVVGYAMGPSTTPGEVRSVRQTRLLDTRHDSYGAMRPNFVRNIQVASRADVPPLAAAAIVTLTVVNKPKAGGYLAAWQTGAVRPATSVANPVADAPVAQSLIVPLGPTGEFSVLASAGGDLVVDLSGYLTGAVLPPVAAPAVRTAQPTSAPGAQALQILQTANRYALQTWWPTTAKSLLAAPMLANQQYDPNDSVRRLGMEAFSLAVSLREGAYDPAVTGMSAANATGVIARIVDAVAADHISNRLGGWGGSWQSDMWASYVGRAGWLIWDDLSGTQQIEVQRMVIYEADFVLTLRPKYTVNANGKLLSPGDTGAEEDSWYALAPALAVAMMPTAGHHLLWLHQQEQLQIAAWAKPDDVASAQIVDGRPLSAWLDGSNVAANGSVTNHNRIAPDYSTNAYQNIDTIVMAALAGQPAPQSSLVGLDSVYAALSDVTYTPSPGLHTPDGGPSGAIYYSTSRPIIFYPQGCDWGTGQEIPYALFDADAETFGFDGSAAIPASLAEAQHAAAAAGMQERPQAPGQAPSGAMYRTTTPPEYTYAGREEHAAQLAAQLYLTEEAAEGHLSWSVTAMPTAPESSTMVESRPALTARDEQLYRN